MPTCSYLCIILKAVHLFMPVEMCSMASTQLLVYGCCGPLGWVKRTETFRLSILIKIQPDATVCSKLFTAKLLYMFRVSQHPSSGVRKTVTAASGTGHNFGTATSFRRGQIGTPGSPDLATLEGSCCTSIMTCTGGCGYSF